MKKYLTGLVTFALLATAAPVAAKAGANWVEYQSGVVKGAIARGETALLFYKSSW
jgi:hypothetical protein